MTGNDDNDNDDSFSSSSSKDDILSDADSDESLLLVKARKKLGRRNSSPSPPSPTSFRSFNSSSLVQYLSTRLIHRKTMMIVGVIATLSLSCSVWNNACYMYMDLLDTPPMCYRMRRVQLNILKSWMSFLVFHCWRVCMPLAFILQCALSIMLDKSAAFATFVARVYFWFVVALSILTVAHLAEIKDVLKDATLC